MSSIFTKIIHREIPSHTIAEDDNFYAFLDIFPIVKGHTLVVPKQETDYIYDLPDDLLAGLHLFAKKVAIGLQKAIVCERISMIVAGFEVPHAHIHLIPSSSMADLSFAHKLKYSPEELAEIAQHIRKYLSL
jgi:histidine triad (HIT) family protein